jgi:glycosyltransferase involved in cell wall biosynthesis
MRIVIDMQGAQTESRFRGIGRYTLSFAQAVARNRGDHEIMLALSGLFPDTIEPIRAAFEGLLPQGNIRVWYAPGPVREREPGNHWRREAAELIREAFLASLKPHVVHIASLFEGYVDDAVTSIGRFAPHIPVTATVHDLIPLLNPDHYLKPNASYEQYYLRKIEYLHRASLLLAISESSRNEALNCLSIREGQVVNTSEAADPKFRRLVMEESQVRGVREQYGLHHPFVLYTGGADERKNLPRLIHAYAKLPNVLRKSHRLVFAGKMPDGDVRHLQAEAQAAGLSPDELRFTGYVTDEALVTLYNLCKLFVFPSWHEGFGLPALEAMSCGAAVIGGNSSSLPEVIGLEAALFDPYSTASIAKKLTQALSDGSFLENLRNHGLSQCVKFSWDRSAKRAIAAFDSLIPFLPGNDQCLRDNDHICNFLLPKLARIPIKGNGHSDADLLKCAFSIAQNLPKETADRQLLVDVSELVQRDAKSGIQRVVRSILKHLLDNPPNGYRVEPVYATLDSSYRYARALIQEFDECHMELSDDAVEFQCEDVFLGLDFQTHVISRHNAFFKDLRNFGVRVFFVIHDLIPYRHPEWFYPDAKEDFGRWLKTISQSDGVVCVSRTTADDFVTWFHEEQPERFTPLKVGWFHNGADIDASLPSYGFPRAYESQLERLRARPFFLTVGTIEPRKGHLQILAAFEQLWDRGTDVQLVIVGKQGWKVDGLVKKLCGHKELGKRLFWLEGISDEYLKILYREAHALIAASLAEGFGLPLIEAAQHRLPIIARDIPVFREVAGKYAFYFSGSDPEHLSKAIRRWLELRDESRLPSSDGLTWLTWAQSVHRLLDVILSEHWYRQLLPDKEVINRSDQRQLRSA